MLMRRLGSLDPRERVLWYVHAVLVHHLVRSEVGREVFRVHALDRIIGEHAMAHGIVFDYTR